MKKLTSQELREAKGIQFAGISTAFICHDGVGKIFMGRRSQKTRDEQGHWDNGGGGLKWGVSAEDNVRREIKEEYDADAKEIEFLGYRDVFRELGEGTKTHWLALDFAVLIDPKQAKNNEPDMTDEVGWFSLNDLPQPLHSQVKPALDEYADKLQRIFNS